MDIMRKKSNSTQGQLKTFFGIDQTTVSRYLKLCDDILSKLLPTGDNIVEIILKTSNTRQLEKYLTDGMIICDGTHVSTDTPCDSEQQKIQYAGGKGQRIFNTLVMINGDGIILYINGTYAGSIDDFIIFKENIESINGILKHMSHGNKRIKFYTDSRFLEAAKIIQNAQSMQRVKGSKNYPLSERQKRANANINKVRIKVEHAICRIKNHSRMVDSYEGTMDKFREELNVVTGIANLHKMWKKICRKRRQDMPAPPWTVYFD